MPTLTAAGQAVLKECVAQLYEVFDEHCKLVEQHDNPSNDHGFSRVHALKHFMSKAHLGAESGFNSHEFDPNFFGLKFKDLEKGKYEGEETKQIREAKNLWSWFKESDKQIIAFIFYARSVLKLCEERKNADITAVANAEYYFHDMNLIEGSYTPDFCYDMPETSMAIRCRLLNVFGVTAETTLESLSGKIKSYYEMSAVESVAVSAARFAIGSKNTEQAIIARSLFEALTENNIIIYLQSAMPDPVKQHQYRELTDKLDAYYQECKDSAPEVIGVHKVMKDFYQKPLSELPYFVFQFNVVGFMDDRTFIDARNGRFLQKIICTIHYPLVSKTTPVEDTKEDPNQKIKYMITVISGQLTYDRNPGPAVIAREFYNELRNFQISKGNFFDIKLPQFFLDYNEDAANAFKDKVVVFINEQLTKIQEYCKPRWEWGNSSNPAKKAILEKLAKALKERLKFFQMPMREILTEFELIYKKMLALSRDEFNDFLVSVNGKFGKMFSTQAEELGLMLLVVRYIDFESSGELIRALGLCGGLLLVFQEMIACNYAHKSLLEKNVGKLSSGRVGEMIQAMLMDFTALYDEYRINASKVECVGELCRVGTLAEEAFLYDQIQLPGLRDDVEPSKRVDALIAAIDLENDYATLKSYCSINHRIEYYLEQYYKPGDLSLFDFIWIQKSKGLLLELIEDKEKINDYYRLYISPVLNDIKSQFNNEKQFYEGLYGYQHNDPPGRRAELQSSIDNFERVCQGKIRAFLKLIFKSWSESGMPYSKGKEQWFLSKDFDPFMFGLGQLCIILGMPLPFSSRSFFLDRGRSKSLSDLSDGATGDLHSLPVKSKP